LLGPENRWAEGANYGDPNESGINAFNSLQLVAQTSFQLSAKSQEQSQTKSSFPSRPSVQIHRHTSATPPGAHSTPALFAKTAPTLTLFQLLVRRESTTLCPHPSTS
jgi:hypothetical protein